MSRKPKTHRKSAVKPQVIDLEAEEIKSEDAKPGTEGVKVETESVAPPETPEAEPIAAEPVAEEPPETETEEAETNESETTEPEVAMPEATEGEVSEPEITEPESADAEPPPAPPAPPHKKAGSAKWIAAALIVGLLAGGWIYRDLLSSYLPTNEMTALLSRLDVMEANGKTMGDQLLAISQSADAASQSADAAKQDVAGLDAKISAAVKGVSDVSARLDTFETRVAKAEEALQSAKADLDTLRNAVSKVGTGTGTVDSAALAAIGQRIDALEKDVASLKASGGGGELAKLTSELSQALADLKAKVAGGASFQSEYERLARMVPAAEGLDVLAAHAADGLPDAAGLAAELTAAIPALPVPESPAPPAEDSYWNWITSQLTGIITIRDIGETDWRGVAEKSAALAQSGDLVQAIAVIDQAEGAKPSALSQWRDRAQARLRLEAAINKVSDAVVRQITALGGAK